MATRDRAQIKRLKDKLSAGGLTEARRARIIKKIGQLGGKVSEQNFPAVGEAGQPGRTKIPKQLAQELKQGSAIGQQFIDQFLPNIDTLGTVDESRSPEVTNALNELRAVADQAGVRSDETKGFLEQLREASLTAGDRTQETSDIISRLNQGLGGLSAEENNALRALSSDSINDSFQTNLRGLSRLQARSGVRGAAASAQFSDIAREKLRANQAFENQLLTDNIAIQDQRRNALASLLQQTEAAEFDRGQRARGQFGEALFGVQKNEFDRSNLARQNFLNQLNSTRDDELSRRKFNLEQQGKLLAGQQGLFLGGLNLVQGFNNAKRNFDLANQSIGIANQNANQFAAANQGFANSANALSGFTSPQAPGQSGGTQSQFPDTF